MKKRNRDGRIYIKTYIDNFANYMTDDTLAFKIML